MYDIIYRKKFKLYCRQVYTPYGGNTTKNEPADKNRPVFVYKI